ncbi:MAG: adenylosuccinate synthase [Christensenellaceae bacterium]
MAGIVVFGAQWGDEGKGRFVDYLAAKADAVVRYQGGNNAGHTVVAKGVTYKLHLVPSGILSPGKACIIANGVVIDPAALREEIEYLAQRGVSVENLYISDRAHMVMPYHRVLDELNEQKLGEFKIGTTGKGIGPCYADKISRIGLRMCDMLDVQSFPKKLKKMVDDKNEIITKIYGGTPLDYEEILEEYRQHAQYFEKYICDTVTLINDYHKNGKTLLFEGAQGMLLDIDFGTYPYVTSSHPNTGGVCAGAGIGPQAITQVIGVVKAYTTRVGEGPFVTELLDDMGEAIRQKGQEFGTTTGRPRRCGWLDLVIVDFAAKTSGITGWALSRMDTLGGFEKVCVCTGYEIDGKVVNTYPASLETLAKAKPIYQEFEGWTDELSQIREYDKLPAAAKKYVEFIENRTGIPVVMIGVGAGREECVMK